MVDEPPTPAHGVPVGRRAADRAPPSLLAKINTAGIAMVFTLVSGAITAVVHAASRLSAAQDHIAAMDKEAIDLRTLISKLSAESADHDRRLAATAERIAQLEGSLRTSPGRMRQ